MPKKKFLLQCLTSNLVSGDITAPLRKMLLILSYLLIVLPIGLHSYALIFQNIAPILQIVTKEKFYFY